MIKAIIFGGTTEGRALCEICAAHNIPAIYCAATDYSGGCTGFPPNITVRAGRLDAKDMAQLFISHRPNLIVDATHPYASEASRNIRLAADETKIRLIRVMRQHESARNGNIFYGDVNEVIARLEETKGGVFSAAGSSLAKALTELSHWRERVWLRILPSPDALQLCLNLGYIPKHIICMQGPFSKEMNIAMFKNTGARALVTKDSGSSGGFTEKIEAANELDMSVAVIKKPEETGGLSLDEAKRAIAELAPQSEP